MLLRLHHKGALSRSEIDGLNAILDATMFRIQEGHPDVAALVMESFLARIEEMVRVRQLTDREGLQLIEGAMALLV